MTTYERPSFPELRDRCIGDVASRTEGAAYVKRSMEWALAHALSGTAHGLHGHLQWVRDQLFPQTAELEGLLPWARIAKVTRNPAVKAQGTVTFAATNGVELPLGVVMQTPAGLQLEVIVAGIAEDDAVVATVRALVEGNAGNLVAGTPLALLSPLLGVDSEGAVAESFGLGADEEKLEPFRARVLDGLYSPRRAGGPGDYRAWAREVSGATRAWEFPKRMGPGTVSVGFVMDDRPDPIPTPTDVAAVQAHIDAVRPGDIRAVYVQAPIAVPIDMTIRIDPNNDATQENVLTELRALFLTAELEGALSRSQIDEAVPIAVNEEDHAIDAISSLSPVTWGLFTLGDVIFEDME